MGSCDGACERGLFHGFWWIGLLQEILHKKTGKVGRQARQARVAGVWGIQDILGYTGYLADPERAGDPLPSGALQTK